jgi:hypothetical protein
MTVTKWLATRSGAVVWTIACIATGAAGGRWSNAPTVSHGSASSHTPIGVDRPAASSTAIQEGSKKEPQQAHGFASSNVVGTSSPAFVPTNVTSAQLTNRSLALWRFAETNTVEKFMERLAADKAAAIDDPWTRLDLSWNASAIYRDLYANRELQVAELESSLSLAGVAQCELWNCELQMWHDLGEARLATSATDAEPAKEAFRQAILVGRHLMSLRANSVDSGQWRHAWRAVYSDSVNRLAARSTSEELRGVTVHLFALMNLVESRPEKARHFTFADPATVDAYEATLRTLRNHIVAETPAPDEREHLESTIALLESWTVKAFAPSADMQRLLERSKQGSSGLPGPLSPADTTPPTPE